MESCNLNSKTQLKFMQSLTGLSSGSSATTGTTTSTVAAPSFTNLLNKGLLETGFVIGAATGTISKVEISIDSGTYSSASGTNTWSYQLPTGSSIWKEGSSHTISARSVDAAGNTSSITSIIVRKGKNKDINGDGYSDVVVGATGYSGGLNKGAIYIFYSSGNSGVTATSATSASKTISGQTNGDKFGYSIALGDVNGDGYADIAVGAIAAVGNKGVTYIFLSNGSNGISANSAAAADASITGANSNDTFGSAVSIGDINGDGYGDLVIAANYYPSSSNNGRVYIFHSNGSSGITATGVGSANSNITGPSNFDNFGTFISTGDVNGDGYADLAAGANGYSGGSLLGAAFVFHSSGNSGITITNPNSASTKIIGGASGDYIGTSICLGDIDGDGYADLIVGAIGTTGNKGMVYIFKSTGASGITATNVSSANTSILGNSPNDSFGFSVSIADFNGDGYGDLAASANGYSGGANKGAVYLFTSSSSGISVTNVNSANTTISGNASSDIFGYFTSVGDLTGDGYADLVIAAKGYNAGTNTGAIYIYHSSGNSGITATTSANASTSILGSAANDLFGTALSVF